MVEIRERGERLSLSRALGERRSEASVSSLWWLGQAGFALSIRGRQVLIDPYLSDSLAREHAGTALPHTRMMPAPASAAELTAVEAVLCTHAHGDHMDPDTLTSLSRANSGCRFLVPRAERRRALAIGLPAERLLDISGSESVELPAGVRVQAIPSAHEELLRDERGDDRFLGYVVDAGGQKLYHSGDCVPYEGLAERIAEAGIDVALLPINGRDERRLHAGILGNFHLDEAIELCARGRVPVMIGHHFGMFDFNTIDRRLAERRAAETVNGVRTYIARIGQRYEVRTVRGKE